MNENQHADSVQSAQDLYGWAQTLFPIHRSLTGDGVRETLRFIQGLAPELKTLEVPSGTQAFDWSVPDEWTIRQAYVEDEQGNRLFDISENTLRVVGYSTPVDIWLDRDELDAHLHSLPDQPDAIPYVTSFYSRKWGFCVTQTERDALPPGNYRAFIDADLQPGSLSYGEIVLPGETDQEIMFSTYVCHPSMANNEVSGPVVTTALARWIASKPRRYTYRLIFVPETIGAILYISRHLEHLREVVRAGFVVTCIGDDRTYSYMPSRRGDTLADRVIIHALRSLELKYDAYSFLQRGSDERQYCSPKVDLPFASVMRSKYGTYPEYHTSLDDLSLVTPTGLWGGYSVLKRCIKIIEANDTYQAVVPCEPQLGSRGLYPTTSQKGSVEGVRTLKNLLAYADGSLDLLEMADLFEIDVPSLAAIADQLLAEGLLKRC